MVPRLVQMLSRHDLPKLQLEAAWAITNIACAEVRHARLLIDNGKILAIQLPDILIRTASATLFN